MDIARKTFRKHNPNIDFETYEGAELEGTLAKFAEKWNKHFCIYIYNEERE
jgi:hypothetical protein